MPKLKVLSGQDVVKIFQQLGFSAVKQRGSHVKLKKLLPAGEKQTLTIPNHSELDKGTLRAILRQASRYIGEDTLRPHFYTQA